MRPEAEGGAVPADRGWGITGGYLTLSAWRLGFPAVGPNLSYGTLVINVSGSFLLGLLMALLTDRYAAPPGWRLFFGIGFLGAYTTFSTFAFESLTLIEDRAYLAAAANVLGNLILGLAAVALSVVVGRIP